MNINFCEELAFDVKDNRVKFSIDELSTNWMSKDDSFIERIDKDNLNSHFPIMHLKKEIQIKNTLDEGISLMDNGKYMKSIEKFDEVLFYDCEYGMALMHKSHALYNQRHFVKSLRYYKRAVKSDESLKDIPYNKVLLKNANDERDNFPKLKRNIHAGDEYFAKGEFAHAVESYNRALANPSKFKQKILSKLINKKATALFKLKEFDEALSCFKKSLEIQPNDYAVFGQGLCEYKLKLKVSDEFKGCLNVSKMQMLKQVLVLNDLGYFKESLKISDFLFENHFKEDDFYFTLTDARKYAMDNFT